MTRRSARNDRGDAPAEARGAEARAALSCAGGLLLRVAPLLLLLAGGAGGLIVLWRTATTDPRFVVEGDTLHLTGPLAGFHEAEEALGRLGRAAAGRSLLEPTLLGEVRAAYEASPWIRRVIRIRRVWPDRIEVEFIVRVPAAQIRYGRPTAYYWLVDEEGVFLPVDGRLRAWRGLPEVVGAVEDRPKRFGERWSDPGLAAALGVMATLRTSPVSSRLPVRRVHVRRGSFLDRLRRERKSRPRIEVETERQVTIRWGTYNGERLPDELLPDEKIALLQTLLHRDLALLPGVALDVRTRDPGYVLPGTAETPSPGRAGP